MLIENVEIVFKNKKHRCTALLDTEYFHLAFMPKRVFESLFGVEWEEGAKVEVLLGAKCKAYISSYAIVDIEFRGRVLKNLHLWLIDKDIDSILPQEYGKMIDRRIDIVLGSTVLENYGIEMTKEQQIKC